MADEFSRPSPEELLNRIKVEEAGKKRGKLKIFLGYAAGVGKTYKMLEEAHQRQEEVDVVVAYVETHGRKETEALLEGLEILPHKQVEYRGIMLPEMDIDAVLARHPQLALVDEFAHTNAPGSRHPKRYQDVEELLEAGIDVYSTLNIQHIESLRTVVAQVTEVWMRETVPDSVIDMASEIELVDLPPEDLLKRLREGKVYIPEQIASATAEFFRLGNLNALREMTMRTAASHVDEQMRAYMESKSIRGPWPTAERLLVYISPESMSTSLVRSARRLAAQLSADWFAVYVETPRTMLMPPEQRERLATTLQLAEKLGAQIITLQGQSGPEVAAEYAQKHNISKIVVGKALKPRWRELIRGSTVEQFTQQSKDVDIVVVKDKQEHEAPPPPIAHPPPVLRNYLLALALLAIATAIAELAHFFFDPTNTLMVYLLSIVVSAVYLGLSPSIVLSFAGVLMFDFLFVPPLYSFKIPDVRYLFTFIAFLAVGIVISYLATRSRQQTEAAWKRERQTEALYALSRDLAISNNLESYIQAILRRAKDTFGYDAIVFLPEGQNNEILKSYTGKPDSKISGSELSAAQWSFQHQKIIGLGTDTLPSLKARFLPLITARGAVGVLALLITDTSTEITVEQERLMEAYTDLTALSLEGIIKASETQSSELLTAQEKLQTAFLSSISHDLRTPLNDVMGALNTLQDEKLALDERTRKSLSQSALEGTERLNHLITNLLDESRIEAGTLKISRQPVEPQMLMNAALEQISAHTDAHQITIDLPSSLPMVSADFGLIVQALVNILDNALIYSLSGSPIEISGRARDKEIEIEVADRGIGIPPEDLERVFDKFYRVRHSEKVGGTGLGLSISKGFVEAHGGKIWAENRPDGGTIIKLTLPIA